MHTYPFHAGDYLKSTAHWSEDETLVEVKAGLLRDLAYRRLLDLYYGEEEAIPAKTRLVAIRIRMLRHEDIVASVLKEKFSLIDGSWRQERADEEVAKYKRKAEAARVNGKLGGRPKTGGQPKKNPVGSDGVATRTRTRTKNSPQPPEGVVVVFEDFWNQHPRKVGKPKALLAFAAKVATGTKPEDIIAGLKRHLPGWAAKKAAGDGEKIPHPTTWLNRDGWTDEVMPEGAKPAAAGEGPGGGWWSTKTGVLDRGQQLGIDPPGDEAGAWFKFMAAVWVAAGDGPWWDKTSVAYPLATRMRDDAAGIAGAVLGGLRRVV